MLIKMARKLCPYFQAHTIKVITDQPLRWILSDFDASEQMLRWLVELNEFDIQYSPRTTIKAQVLTDFISKLTPKDHTFEQENGENT